MKNPNRLQNESGFEQSCLPATNFSNPAVIPLAPTGGHRANVTNLYSDYQRAEQALSHIPADCARDIWVKVAQAIKSEFGDTGFEMFDHWSQGGVSYNERDTHDTYKSVKQSGGVTFASLFYLAKQHGYNGGRTQKATTYQSARKMAQIAAKRAAEASREQRELDEQHAHAAAASKELLARLPDATAENLYLRGKNLPSVPGLKQTPDGKLVIPVFDEDGEVCTLQFIDGDGNKQFKRGGKLKGGFFLIGGEPTTDLLECEGVAKGITLHMAMGLPVAVAFSKDNMLAVAKLMEELYPLARMTVCADNDRFAERNGGVEAATNAAAAVGGFLAIPQFTGEHGTDFDDLRLLEGLDAVRQQVQAAWQTPVLANAEVHADANVDPPPMRYRVMSAADLCNTRPMQWMVSNVLPTEGLAAIYGASGSGKSFLALDVAAAVAGGASDWFGHRVKQVAVTFVALEGEQGISKRVQAWMRHHGKDAPQQLRFISQPLNLSSESDVDALGAAVVSSGGHGGLIILDTLNRAAEGADENSSAHMGKLIGGAKRLQGIIGGLVLLIHHTGKDKSAGLRGHSSLHAALDAAIEVDRSGDDREWRIAKSKDDEDGRAHPFRLELMTVGADEYGDDITSCVILPDDRVPAAGRPKPPTGKNHKLAANVLAAPLAGGQVGIAGVPAGRSSIRLDDAVNLLAQHLDCDANKRNYNARQIIERMVENGFYGMEGGWLWAN